MCRPCTCLPPRVAPTLFPSQWKFTAGRCAAPAVMLEWPECVALHVIISGMLYLLYLLVAMLWDDFGEPALVSLGLVSA